MKKAILGFAVIFLISAGINTAEAQFNPLKKLKKKAEQKVEEKIDESLDPKEKQKDQHLSDPAENQTKKEDSPEPTQAAETSEEGKDALPKLSWAKYDFIPGEEVFFEDNQTGEENGEFPSRWDIYDGNVEMARLGEDMVIMFREDSRIMPYIENPDQDYLPDVFTLEFDCYFTKDENYQNYEVRFFDKLNQKGFDLSGLRIYWNKCVLGRFEGWYPGVSNSANVKQEGWRHVSIAFNKRALKVYLDDTRVLNIPNLRVNPTGITIAGEYNEYKEIMGYIKNIWLARGGVKLYDKMIQDGKIIANGIRFDVGKSTLKPESMGIINKVVEMMQEHPDLKFSIEGHTDNDGDTESNQKLSENRAMSVKEKMESMGIDPDRLSTKGFGESNPVTPNTTAEGKANNRRVEFVRVG